MPQQLKTVPLTVPPDVAAPPQMLNLRRAAKVLRRVGEVDLEKARPSHGALRGLGLATTLTGALRAGAGLGASFAAAASLLRRVRLCSSLSARRVWLRGCLRARGRLWNVVSVSKADCGLP
eukprot:3782251-Amphidinium_carterae.2